MNAKKIFTFDDSKVEKQFQEIIDKWSHPEFTLVFTSGIGLSQKADIGYLCDRFRVIDKSANITIYRTGSDSRYMYFTASGVGTVTVECWKQGG